MIGLIRRALGRRGAKRAEAQLRQYAGAQISRLTGDWLPVGTDVNSIIGQSAPLVRARTQQLIRDFAPFHRGVNALSAFVIGQGIRFQSRVMDGAGRPDKRARQRIEDGWLSWMDRASLDGQHHFYDLQELVERQRAENGEFFCLFQGPRGRGRHPLALNFIEPSRVGGSQLIAPGVERKIIQGVEYDALTGERLAYHFDDEDLPGRSCRVEADLVLHDWRRLRPGQMRGITELAPAILIARDLGEYVGAEVDAANMAAKWLAVVTTPDPGTFQGLRAAEDPDTGQRVETLENAIIEYLRPGEEIKLASHNRPGDAFEGFCRFLMRLVSITLDVPYEILSGDYQGINYTTLRGSRTDFKQTLIRRVRADVLHFCQPVFRRWLRLEVARGALDLPGFWRDPARYERGVWIPAGMAPIDPLKEAKADVELIKAGLKSPQQVILARGDDPEEVLDQLADWREMCAERELEFNAAAISTALANNPAALDGAGEN